MSTCVLAIGHVPTITPADGAIRRGLVLAVAVLLAMSSMELLRPLLSAEQGVRLPPATATAPSEGTWPEGLRDAARAAIDADAYSFAAAPDGRWATTTPSQGLRTTFGPAGLSVGARDGSWALEMSLAHVGRPGSLVAPDPADLVGSAHSMEYRRGPGLTEWYRNDARGLEQGFTVATAPSGGPGPLVLELETSGLPVALSSDGTEVLAGAVGAGHVLRYTGLEVADAAGRALPTRLAVEGQVVRLVIDDAGSTYPLAVDPWFQQAKLTASDASSSDGFGVSVAVSGDTAVVGAYQDGTDAGPSAGSAYVFVRSAGSWTQQAKLVASPLHGAASDNFGISVAISGETSR
jgi:hypothetical protein